MEGCSWIIARFKEQLLIYHDRHPSEDFEDKMAKIYAKEPLKVYRVDEYSQKNKYTTYLYGEKTSDKTVFGA